MSATVDEFRELLNAEVHVDIYKLRDAARHGVPDDVRGEVWKYLLGVEEADRSHEMSDDKEKSLEYLEFHSQPLNSSTIKRVRGEVSRYLRRTAALLSIRNMESSLSMFENVISTYVSGHRSIDYEPGLIYMCAPFVYSLDKESEIYFCFERLMRLMDDYFSDHSINKRVAHFMALFRMTIPDLHSYFEEEEVDPTEWATSWLQYLLSKELPLNCVLRLWDTYFSDRDGLDLHVYMCLALLRHLKDSLEELEHSEIRALLFRLPDLDMEQIINQAYNIRHEILERQMFEILDDEERHSSNASSLSQSGSIPILYNSSTSHSFPNSYGVPSYPSSFASYQSSYHSSGDGSSLPMSPSRSTSNSNSGLNASGGLATSGINNNSAKPTTLNLSGVAVTVVAGGMGFIAS